jgi:hypothetical protein
MLPICEYVLYSTPDTAPINKNQKWYAYACHRIFSVAKISLQPAKTMDSHTFLHMQPALTSVCLCIVILTQMGGWERLVGTPSPMEFSDRISAITSCQTDLTTE